MFVGIDIVLNPHLFSHRGVRHQGILLIRICADLHLLVPFKSVETFETKEWLSEEGRCLVVPFTQTIRPGVRMIVIASECTTWFIVLDPSGRNARFGSITFLVSG